MIICNHAKNAQIQDVQKPSRIERDYLITFKNALLEKKRRIFLNLLAFHVGRFLMTEVHLKSTK